MKKLIMCLLVATVLLLVGCGGQSKNTETVASKELTPVSMGNFELFVDESWYENLGKYLNNDIYGKISYSETDTSYFTVEKKVRKEVEGNQDKYQIIFKEDGIIEDTDISFYYICYKDLDAKNYHIVYLIGNKDEGTERLNMTATHLTHLLGIFNSIIINY